MSFMKNDKVKVILYLAVTYFPHQLSDTNAHNAVQPFWVL